MVFSCIVLTQTQAVLLIECPTAADPRDEHSRDGSPDRLPAPEFLSRCWAQQPVVNLAIAASPRAEYLPTQCLGCQCAPSGVATSLLSEDTTYPQSTRIADDQERQLRSLASIQPQRLQAVRLVSPIGSDHSDTNHL